MAQVLPILRGISSSALQTAQVSMEESTTLSEFRDVVGVIHEELAVAPRQRSSKSRADSGSFVSSIGSMYNREGMRARSSARHDA